MRRPSALLVIALLGAGLLIPAHASALPVNGIVLPGGSLGKPLHATAAVWTGEEAILFGGYVTEGIGHADSGGHWTTDEILHYRPDSGKTRLSQAKLPMPRGGASAVWSGDVAYIFGGSINERTPSADILQYDPKAQRVEALRAQLPSARDWTASVWAPNPTPACPTGCAYVFGGGFHGTGTNQIVRFEPTTQLVSIMPTRLPQIQWASAAVWDERKSTTCPAGCAYLVGGYNDQDNLNSILRYNPVDGIIQQVATIPMKRESAAIAWDGKHAWIFGGHVNRPHTFLAEILRFDPQSTVPITPVCAILSHPLGYAAAVWTGDAALVFGGNTLPAGSVDEVLEFRPSDGAIGGLCGDELSDLLQGIREDLRELPAGIFVTPEDRTIRDLGTAFVTLDPGKLPNPLHGVPAAPTPVAGALPVYIQSEPAAQPGKVRLEMRVPPTLREAGLTPSIHAHDGAQWVDLGSVDPGTTIDGKGIADLRVESVGYDESSNTAWAVVDRLGTFALAPSVRESVDRVADTHRDRGASLPAPLAFLSLLVALAVLGRRSAKP